MSRLQARRWRPAGRLAVVCAGFAWGVVGAQPPVVPTPRIVNVDPAPPPRPLPPTTRPASDPLPVEQPPPAIDPGALGGDVMPIDLPTALRLVDANNPTVAVARLRYCEALIRQQEADVQWLPTLSSNTVYYRHDGRIQNTAGRVFDTSKSSLFAGDELEARVDTADALFVPLVARRLAAAEAAAREATSNGVQLEVALAYLELLRAYGALAINGEILSKEEYLLNVTEAAVGADQSSTAGDGDRVRAEVEGRRQERRGLEARAAAASARLVRLLLLKPGVNLTPAEPSVLPVTVVDLHGDLEEMAAVGLAHRPELAQSRELTGAAMGRLRQARVTPLLPQLDVAYAAGKFGGGEGGRIGDGGVRGDGLAQATWELRNFGAYDILQMRERKTQYDEAEAHAAEVRAEVTEQVVVAAKEARARLSALPSGEEGVKRAEAAWDKLRGAAFQEADRRHFDPVSPLLAVQALAQARYRYLDDVIDYNQAQFRLYTAMGQPPVDALNCPRP